MGMTYIGCNQRIPEYHAWVCLCAGMKAKSYVELGCGSAHYLRMAGVERVITVDLLPNGLGDPTITHLQMNSNDPQTLAAALELLKGPPDVVFIDADHEADAVRRDFGLWYPHAQMAVGFHDILMPSVYPAWEEIALSHPSVQIVGRDIASAEQWQHGGHVQGHVNCGGIGVVFK
jgi:hypothetical protein